MKLLRFVFRLPHKFKGYSIIGRHTESCLYSDSYGYEDMNYIICTYTYVHIYHISNYFSPIDTGLNMIYVLRTDKRSFYQLGTLSFIITIE